MTIVKHSIDAETAEKAVAAAAKKANSVADRNRRRPVVGAERFPRRVPTRKRRA